MSRLSEEETPLKEEKAIEIIQDLIKHTKENVKYNIENLSEYRITNRILAYRALETILDLYNKEKEKNKTLEELLQGRLFELYKYYKDLASEYQGNCVSKDKIKPIQIIDLDGKIHNVYKIEEE